ncbi:zinc finger and BTB domain-containing protein 16-A-like isoform X2 [Oncorhynchus kisutch]|uniref:zinc finger and BTB domain-containing protein 16-A-like isoform X2 n=1 Tax=Oncorhynchus kisutch TaxID=8019 RepID=UPI0012DE3C88|nr:zinc finger and BTB domain-containing protein 16-A-like isoform X2 [Oncorhynchus kisutch]
MRRGTMSGSVVEFQAQIASIMEVLANAAVTEICKIVDDGYAVVHMEMSQSHKDNEFLRRKMKLMELQIARFRAERTKFSEGSVHNRFHGIRLLNRHNHRETATTGPTWQSRNRLSNRSFGNSSIQRDRQPIDVDQEDASPSKHMDATSDEQSAETEEGQPDLLIIKVEGEADYQDSRFSHPARTVEGSRELTTQPAAATTEDPAFQSSGPRGNNNYNNTAMEQSAETEEGEPDLLIIKDEGVADDQKTRFSHPARTVEGSRELTTQPAAATTEDPAFQSSGPRGNNNYNTAMESGETEEGEPDLLIIKVEGEADDQDSRISHPARTVEGSRELTTQLAAATTEDTAFQSSGPRGNNNYNNIAMEVSGSDVVFQSETGNVNQGLQQYTGFEPRAERPSLDTKCDMYGGLNLLRDSLNQVCREVVATDNGASAAHTKVMDLGSGSVGPETQTSSDIEMRSVGLENHRFSPKLFHSSSEHVIVIDSVSSGQQVDRDFEWGQVGTASTQVNGTGNTQGEGVFERNAPTMASLHRHFEIPGRGVQQPAHTSLPVGHFRQSATTSSHSSNLAAHVRPDTIERLYGCLSCHKKFVHESDLRQHAVIHTRKRAFACTLCEKSFMSRTDLQMHLNVHTGEKPFSCAHCGRRFSHSSNLKRHQKLHH